MAVDGFVEIATEAGIEECEDLALDAVEVGLNIVERLLNLLHIAAQDADSRVDSVEAVVHGGVNLIEGCVHAVESLMHLDAKVVDQLLKLSDAFQDLLIRAGATLPEQRD